MIDARGKVAVVTGASSGLGRRIALELARAGSTVIGVARREPLLEQLAGEMRATAPGSGYRVCDVADHDAYRVLLQGLEAEHGRIDVLVQAAAIEQRTRAEQADLDLYRRILDTNFWAVVVGTLAVVPGMAQRGFGVVVNVSSDSARAPAPEVAPYAASKAALSAFTESLAHELSGRGVHLHVLYPGWVPTAMGMAAVEAGMPMPPRYVRRTEEQVAQAVLEKMGGPSIEINLVRVAVLAGLARAFFPRTYRKQVTART